MDPRDRADLILARARARGAYVVTPDSATSPMDVAATLQIPRAVMSALDAADPDVTMVFPVDELPAIAQEAATQSLASPPKPAPRVPAAPQPEQLDGLIPTTKQPPSSGRPSMSQRLDGGDRG
ncbi:hypothetical protein UO65_2277 [Actinokineospora spheciospongiae]|uniref:Uncharacterized protein n=1 Tax=Actinokineospora spheciospongiae TaxID=909613 RepID=W7IPT7_9PSEU|nr:hypothetical protein [Actinokineospora spheciospongiae]EWC62408.1 hypothetical protein UO65_2277 [Actinokineospora spheciospongiae]PWW64575.1 hypothetical protein DFQ13_103549 [Actinokineospora spheciospongiae]